MVLVSTVGGVSVVPMDGGAATTIDATGFMGQLIEGGKVAVYGTTGGALRMSSTHAAVNGAPFTADSTYALYSVVSQADAVIELTPAADQTVYSWSLQPGALAGIYVTPVP
jgi:hypothetical protein